VGQRWDKGEDGDSEERAALFVEPDPLKVFSIFLDSGLSEDGTSERLHTKSRSEESTRR